MSSTKIFNGLGGTVATRESLIELQLQAKAESNTEVYRRVTKLLNTYPDASSFELEVESIVVEKKVSLTLKVQKKGEELHYMHNSVKVASINKVGTITWHKKGIEPKHRRKIRKDAQVIGLNAPQEEDCDAEMLHGLEQETADHEETHGLGKPVTPDAIYDMITKRMLDLIKSANKGDYKRAWNDEGYLIPYNFESKKPYKGVNSLMLTPIFGTLDNPYYLTFNQIKENGGTLKKGSKASQVVYYSKTERDYTDNEIEKINKAAAKEALKKGDKKEFYFLKYYNVFSGSDVEGIDFDLANFDMAGKVESDITGGKNEKIDLAEKIVKNYPNPPAIEFKGNKAFFSPSKDLVCLPPIEKFKSSQDFYRTFFHELSHSTGHESRLKRDFSGSFGSKEYAYEELIAEFGAVFLSAQSGIMFYTNKNHAGYLKGWNEVLVPQMKKDNRFLLRAGSAAQKASDYILDGISYANEKPEAKKRAQKTRADLPAKKEAKKTAPKPVARKADKQAEIIGYAIIDNIDGSIVASKKTLPELEKVYQRLDVFIEDMPVLVHEIIRSGDKNELGKKVPVKWEKIKVDANGQVALFGSLNAPNETESSQNITPTASYVPQEQKIITHEQVFETVEPISEIIPEPAKAIVQTTAPANINSLAYRRQNRTDSQREYYKIDNPDLAEFLGKIEIKKKESVAVTIAGGQGSGKTSFVFQVMDAFASNYRVGHASIEEHPESALYENKAERFWSEHAKNVIDSPEINSMQDIHELIMRNDVIVIDSFSKLISMDRRITLDDTFRKKYDGKLFIIIYQLTTDGSMRGGSASQFDGDVILFVEKFPNFNDNYVYADKNRYQEQSLDGLHYNIATGRLIQEEEEKTAYEFTEIERI
ncbi:zincin-like metallopeptidase domain-containing protein [Flavobacterium mesophilum]|uniref:zincin-like metallopeptidase domain-containing protein n=1 Tax=Flavobacterium mesophilum TaxID=3143495 RepID=UPI0031E4807A